MKTIFFRSLLSASILVGIALIFSACEQENILDHLNETELQETDTNIEDRKRGPLILADVSAGDCCGHVYGVNRSPNIVLDDLTHNFYCVQGSGLYYKFYSYGNPTAPPIVKNSDDYAPSFCLPTKNYALLICNNADCKLTYVNGNFHVSGPGSNNFFNINLPACITLPHE